MDYSRPFRDIGGEAPPACDSCGRTDVVLEVLYDPEYGPIGRLCKQCIEIEATALLESYPSYDPQG
jgi:hypothetical protein